MEPPFRCGISRSDRVPDRRFRVRPALDDFDHSRNLGVGQRVIGQKLGRDVFGDPGPVHESGQGPGIHNLSGVDPDSIDPRSIGRRRSFATPAGAQVFL